MIAPMVAMLTWLWPLLIHSAPAFDVSPPVAAMSAVNRELYGSAVVGLDEHLGILLEQHKQGCEEDGAMFAEGSAMMTSLRCRHCFCLKGKKVCVRPKCGKPIEGCKPRYKRGSCCPTHYDCVSSESKNQTSYAANYWPIDSPESFDQKVKILTNKWQQRTKRNDPQSEDEDNGSTQLDDVLETTTNTADYEAIDRVDVFQDNAGSDSTHDDENYVAVQDVHGGGEREEEEDLVSDGAERAIEVRVSSSVSSVTGNIGAARVVTAADKKSSVSTQETVSSVSVNASVHQAPLANVNVARPAIHNNGNANNNQDANLEYPNMELPPSLPNLVMESFRAEHAMIVNPSDHEDDERLSVWTRVTSTARPTRRPFFPTPAAATNKGATRFQSTPATMPPPPASTLTITTTAATLAATENTARFQSATSTAATTTARKATSKWKNKTPTKNQLIPGGLRIDGCNIYGQIYRVGHIIDELSGPCLECQCTEIGVDCNPLDCSDQ